MGQSSGVPRDVRRRFRPLFAKIDRTYGSSCVTYQALLLMRRARRALGTLTYIEQQACVTIAMKYVEDEPCGVAHVFPGIDIAALRLAEWKVMDAVKVGL